MKFKKIGILFILFSYFFTQISSAADIFSDKNSISEFSSNGQIIISEHNTGKIISSQAEDEQVTVENLPNYLAALLLTEQIKEKKLTADSSITLLETDSVLDSYSIAGEISVKDALFLLEQENSSALNKSIFNSLNITLEQANKKLSTLSLNSSVLASFESNAQNKSTARNIAFLVNTTIKNYPDLLQITKNPEYTLNNEKKITNNLKFEESNKMRLLGLTYSNTTSINFAYSGDTRILIIALNHNKNKEEFFTSLKKTYEYIFDNYNYKLALKAGTYNINNENIEIEHDLYDLFYKTHSIKDITYLLMNNKILIFQKYDTISANEGAVFSNFTSKNTAGVITKIKQNFTNDTSFDKKTNLEKTTVVINRGRYFATGVLLIYTSVFLVGYILKKIFRRR